VRVVLFTGDTGCPTCPEAAEIAAAIKKAAPKVAVETYDIVMDRDKTEIYGIKRAPAFVVQGPGDRMVMFSGAVDGITLILLLEAISGVAAGRAWLPEKMTAPLRLLEKNVSVQVFVENDCPLCKPVAETAMGLALVSSLVSADIIVSDQFEDLAAKMNIKMLPTTIFGKNLRMEGHVPEDSFLEMIFLAEGQQAAMPKKLCVVCGKSSPDVICAECKSRIQAEALDHKRAGEKLKQAGTIVKPRQNP
jgi:thiol-disulfide isomerase/thioredoxin